MALSIVMGTGSDGAETRAANLRRLDELVVRLDVKAEARALATEVCRSFDVAAEFAACEGLSIREALDEYFCEAESPSTAWGSLQAALRKLFHWETAVVRNAAAPLPVMPAAVSKLLNLREESVSVPDLESVCGSDPVLTAQILSLANSVRFGSRLQITRVGEAIQRVGIPEARKALLAACLSGLFASKGLQDLWDHSRHVAEIAWVVAGLCGADRATAYTAGLLHDIGRLAFLRGPGHLQADEWGWMAAGCPQVYAETLVRGEDHAAAGANLLAGWELPPELVESVRFHHRPEASKNMLGYILFLAEDLAGIIENKPAEDLWGPMRRQLSLQRAGITPEAMAQAISTLEEPALRRVC